jgi:hypothetical protein
LLLWREHSCDPDLQRIGHSGSHELCYYYCHAVALSCSAQLALLLLLLLLLLDNSLRCSETEYINAFCLWCLLCYDIVVCVSNDMHVRT